MGLFTHLLLRLYVNVFLDWTLALCKQQAFIPLESTTHINIQATGLDLKRLKPLLYCSVS